MPRLPHSLLWSAKSLSPYLPSLLRACRDLPSARNELRWLSEYIAQLPSLKHSPCPQHEHHLLWQAVLDRQRGKPLQYILGSQPFGNLNILCGKGVLIPRPETERYTLLLADRLRRFYNGDCLRVIEPCTGTGCISLSLYSQLWRTIKDMRIEAFDYSKTCLSYVRRNLALAIKEGNLPPNASQRISVSRVDLFNLGHDKFEKANILISNPPYISPAAFNSDTQRSVRTWEPVSALVPPFGGSLALQGDSFYPALLALAESRGCELVLMEVGDYAQARRVMDIAEATNVWTGGEIWHDDLWKAEVGPIDSWTAKDGFTRSIGQGEGRAVVLWRGQRHKWLGYSS